jgi:hypothetical protein
VCFRCSTSLDFVCLYVVYNSVKGFGACCLTINRVVLFLFVLCYVVGLYCVFKHTFFQAKSQLFPSFRFQCFLTNVLSLVFTFCVLLRCRLFNF